MSTFAFACLLLCPQDSDRSTPEKAFEYFIGWWEKLENDDSPFRRMEEEVEKLGDFSRTEDMKARRAKKREEMKKSMEDYKTLESKYEIAGRTDGKDGSVALDVRQKVRKNQKDYKSGKVEVVEQTLPHRFIFEKAGAHWLIRLQFRPCYSCDGTGGCRGCKGTGKTGDRDCPSCKGAKSCSYCKGEKVLERKMTEGSMGLLPEGAEPKASNDLSTPKAAAQTYVDLTMRQSYARSRLFRDLLKEILPKFRLSFVESICKAIDEKIAKDPEETIKKMEDSTPKQKSLEEKGDAAFAVFTVRDRQQRIVFKKVADKWLVDAEESPCYSCQGGGKCLGCNGEGKVKDAKCARCEGSGSCKSCGGQGWKE